MAGTNPACSLSGWQVVDNLDTLDAQTICLESGLIAGDPFWLDDSYWFENFDVGPSQFSDANSSRKQELDATSGKAPGNLFETAPMDSRSSTNYDQLYGLTVLQ